MSGTKEQLAAVKRLLPPTEAIYVRVRDRLNKLDKASLKSFYDNATDLAKVWTDPEKYGLESGSDLPDALGFEKRQVERYRLVGRVITKEEIALYQSEQSVAGREFSATHLMVLATMDSVADRKRAWKQWKQESYSSQAFEVYVSDCRKEAAAAAAGIDSDDEGVAETAAGTGVSPTKAVKKFIAGLAKLEPLFATMAGVDLGSLKAGGDDTVQESLEYLKSLLTAVSTQADAIVQQLSADPLKMTPEEAAARLAALSAPAVETTPAKEVKPKAAKGKGKQPAAAAAPHQSLKRPAKKAKPGPGFAPPASVDASVSAALESGDPGTGPAKRRQRGSKAKGA
jgi:hypothetical protein